MSRGRNGLVCKGGLVAAVTLLASIGAGQQVSLTTGDAALLLVDHGAVQELKDPAGAPGSGITKSSGDGSRSSPWLFEFSPGGGGLDVGSRKVCANFDAVELGNTDGGASFTLDMGGENVGGTSGNISFSTLDTLTGWGGYGSGHIAIYNVGAVDIGSIETYNKATAENAGDVRIGQPAGTGSGPATGNIRVDKIQAYETVLMQQGGIVKLYGGGNVLIQTAGGVTGDIDASATGLRGPAHGPHVQMEVIHHGSFSARDLLLKYERHDDDFRYGLSWNYVGSINLHGGSAGGNAVIRDINTMLLDEYSSGSAASAWAGAAGHVTITGYRNVTIRGIDTHQRSASTDGESDGGNVAITNIEAGITIQGPLNLEAQTVAGSDGILTLSCGGVITLAELPLDRILKAALNSGGKIYVMGKLTGFPVSTPANGMLDCPAGQYIYYKPNLPENAYLGGRNYTLKSGGILRSAPSGTVVMFR